MSTATTSSRRRRMLSRSENLDPLPPDSSLPPRTKSASPWPWRLLYIGLSLLLVLWAAPMIVAATGLQNKFLQMAIDPSQGTIRSQSASLGWFSPITLKRLEVVDPDGEPLLVAESITTSKSLLGFLTDTSVLGTIRVERPEARVQLHSDTSNIERFIAPWQESEESSGSIPSMEIDLVDGKILLVDTTTGRQWHLEQLDSKVNLSSDAGNPLTVQLAAAVTDGLEPSRLDCEFSVPLDKSQSTEPLKLKLQTQKLPMLALHGLLMRVAPGTQLFGTLTSDVACTFKPAADGHLTQLTLQGHINADQLTANSPYLNGDQLKLAHLEVPCHLTLENSRLIVHDVRIRCDLGQAALNGSVDLTAMEGDGFLPALMKENYTLGGKLDLARLAAALPNTLRIKEQTAVTSGSATWNLVSSTDATGHRWEGQLQTSGLAAMQGEQRVAWEQPVLVNLLARNNAQGITIDQLSCQSDFLQVTAAGTPNQLTGKAKFDLTELMAKLDQFVDLGSWRIAGQGEADLAWIHGADGTFRAGVALDLQNFQLNTPDSAPWKDPQLLIEATAAGRWTEGKLVEVSAAEARVGATPDEIHALLTAPVAQATLDSTWPLDVSLKGNLARWTARLRPFVSLDGLQIDGETTLHAKLLASANSIEAQQAKVHIDEFAYTGSGLFVREPVLELNAVGKWTQPTGRLDLGASALRGNDLLVETEGMSLVLGDPAGPSMAGKLHLATPIERLHHYTLDPAKRKENRAPDTWIYIGRIDGTADLQHVGQQTTAALNINLRPLHVLQRKLVKGGRISNQARWSESNLALQASGVYDQLADQLQLTRAALKGQSIELNAAGVIDQLLTSMHVNLNGTLAYDLEALMPVVERFAGPGINLTGKESGSFALKGPVWGLPDQRGVIAPWSQRLAGNLSLGWQGGKVYGLDLGAGKTSAALEKGLIRFAPLKVALSEGELTTAPVIQFDPEPATVYLPKGPLLTKVKLSPEFCDAWLKYTAPVMAEATQTNGKLSIDLDGGRIPLSAPSTSDIGGRLVLHQVQVMPGPLANDYILLGQQLEAILKKRVPPASLEGQQSALLGIADQTVPFRMVEGRIHHQNLIAGVAGTTLTTQGSVGVDQTMSISAVMPMADRWLGSEPALQGFKGQVIQVNVGGTLSKPVIDKRSLDQMAGQLVRGAVQNTIQNELSKQLDRFLPQKK